MWQIQQPISYFIISKQNSYLKKVETNGAYTLFWKLINRCLLFNVEISISANSTFCQKKRKRAIKN